MSLVADIFTAVKALTVTMQEQLQVAAQGDRPHYEIKEVKNLQIRFDYDTGKWVHFYADLVIHPLRLIETPVMQYFLGNVVRSLNMEMLQHPNCTLRTGKTGTPEASEVWQIVFRGKFTPNEAPETPEEADENLLVLSYEQIEEETDFKFAVYEGADIPDNIIYRNEPHQLISFDDKEQEATFKKGLKTYA